MRGVTLLELLVCALVLAILAALAVPAYQGPVLRARRSDARGALLQVLASQERNYLEHGRYSADLAGAPAAGGLGLSGISEAGWYALQVQLTAGGSGYLATATPLQGQRGDARCTSLSIDERGTRGATGSDPQASRGCWR